MGGDRITLACPPGRSSRIENVTIDSVPPFPDTTARSVGPAGIGTWPNLASLDPRLSLLRSHGRHTDLMAYQVMTVRFIGRTQELAWLRERLGRATTGEPQVALISGEAGVGKTRLTEQLASTASEQGVRVLHGGSVPLGEEGVPFAPVTEALRGLARELDPAEFEAVAGPARADLARLLPELAGNSEAAVDAGAGVGGSPDR